MKTVLEFLEEHPDQFVSGELIANALSMTRANVWKEIQKLKSKNYCIESVRNQGYKLLSRNNNISVSYIESLLNPNTLRGIEYLESVDSTNTYAKDLAKDSNLSDVLIVSDNQTAGRGRMGRSFYSPSQNGVYMSFILRPTTHLEDTQLLTLAAAVAVIKSLKQCLDIDAQIKWLNDIYINNQKLSGILTEGEIILESQSYKYLVLGIGINVFTDNDIPDSISNIYTSIDKHTTRAIDRNECVAAITNNFYEIYNSLPDSREKLLDEYRTACFILGEEVWINNDPKQAVTAVDINDQGHLLVKDKHGNERLLYSGEVSIGGKFKHES